MLTLQSIDGYHADVGDVVLPSTGRPLHDQALAARLQLTGLALHRLVMKEWVRMPEAEWASAVVTIGELRSVEAVPLLISNLELEYEGAHPCEEALVAIGSPALPYLRQALAEPKDDAQKERLEKVIAAIEQGLGAHDD
jgi:hypothetical protein